MRFAALAAALAGGGALIEWLFVSDTERIEEVLDAAAAAAVRRDAEGILAAFAEDFSQDGIDGTALRAGVTAALARHPARGLEWIHRDIRVEGGVAQAFARLRYVPAPGASIPYPFDTTWRLDWEKRDNAWRITRVELADPGGRRNHSLRTLLERGY